jgi:hypothetical protein
MFVDTYTSIHSIISLLALALGPIAILSFFGVRIPSLVMPLFLLLAFLTSATGFGFPFHGVILPSHITGVVALVVLAALLYARFVGGLAGIWRSVYVAGVVASAFLLAFVGVAQAFGKIAALNALAPTQSEPPFAIAELVLLVIFVVIGFLAVKGWRPEMMPPLGPRQTAH